VENLRTIIAGYYWFTDWGRDTMISLEGLTLTTGRESEARQILCSFSNYIRDGLIPNLFPEGEDEGRYDTADATLWFFHAVDRYLAYTQDWSILKTLLPKLLDIVEHHMRGTRFGIGVDPEDGLLSQGDQGYALTWMDAKYGEWIVTPRRGKAVEINALWYNALCLLAEWVEFRLEDKEKSRHLKLVQSRHREVLIVVSGTQSGCLYDVIDGEAGDDVACRPNQIFAIALPHPVLTRSIGNQYLKRSGVFFSPARTPYVRGETWGLQTEISWGSHDQRLLLSPGNCLAMADRALYRCLAKGDSRRQA